MNPMADGSALTDLELLAVATRDAMAAHAAGLVIGPPLDEVELLRTAGRLREAETTRLAQPRPAVWSDAA